MPALDGPGLIIVFVAAAIATWIAGLYLSRATDALDVRLGLGEAAASIIIRTKRRHAGFGLDSILNTLLYVLGVIGLVQIAS